MIFQFTTVNHYITHFWVREPLNVVQMGYNLNDVDILAWLLIWNAVRMKFQTFGTMEHPIVECFWNITYPEWLQISCLYQFSLRTVYTCILYMGSNVTPTKESKDATFLDRVILTQSLERKNSSNEFVRHENLDPFGWDFSAYKFCHLFYYGWRTFPQAYQWKR